MKNIIIGNSDLKRLWGYLSKRRKKQYKLSLILMIVSSILEVVSIGAIFPFLGALTAPEHIYLSPFMQPLIKILGLTSPDQLLLPLTIFFIFSALMAGAVRLLLLYVMTRLSYATGADISIKIYRRTLYQEYKVHLLRNSSEVINGIILKTNTVIGGVVSPVIVLISSIILVIGIISAIVAINAIVALSAFFGLGVFYWLVIKYTKKRLKVNSKIIADQSTYVIKSLQEGLGGVREVLIDGSQEFYCELYRNADLSVRHAAGNNKFISGSPKYVIEAIGMSVISIIAYGISFENGGLNNAIPTLGALALGAQRLLPVLQQSYNSYSSIVGSRSSLKDVLSLLDQPISIYENQNSSESILFEKRIEIKKLYFRYQRDMPFVLENINLAIPKGERVGFVGVTGSGKSTLIDVVMSLLTPTKGEIMIDGIAINQYNFRAWQKLIAHVPQNIYLSDSSIEENIAFGIPKEMIDYQQVIKAAKQAQISEMIDGWKNGYQTIVGEQGVRLSGGQRQRIGIARALYKKADILIFDEATSALDNETEKNIMNEIQDLDKELTILIIAHRLTTLQGCDRIVCLNKNNSISILSYPELTRTMGDALD